MLEDVAGFVAWLRLPPQARGGRVAVLPTVAHSARRRSVNRKLSALTSFCGFHARHGVELSGLLVTMRRSWARPGCGDVVSAVPAPCVQNVDAERRRTVTLKSPRCLPEVLTAQQVQAILEACEHLRDRFLFALLLDTGMFSRGQSPCASVVL